MAEWMVFLQIMQGTRQKQGVRDGTHMNYCRQLLTLTVLMLFAVSAGCHTRRTETQSCVGDESCAAAGSPLIIFIGANRDLMKSGKLPQVTDDFRAYGYDAVYLDPWTQMGDAELLADWIRTAVTCQGRQVMLVGWSYGTVVGLEALDIVASEGIGVDTFVELDCFNLTWHRGDGLQAANAQRVVVIRSSRNQRTVSYCRPVVHRLDKFWHLHVPTDERTRCILLAEANQLRCVASQNDDQQYLKSGHTMGQHSF
jgi:hypothetical protein